MTCFDFLQNFRGHFNEPSADSETTSNAGEINQPDVALEDIVKNLLSFLFDEFKKLHEAKKDIEEKYGIGRRGHTCWTEDDIKRAWRETDTMDVKSKRKQWACVIILQVAKTFVCDTCKQNTAQENRNVTTDAQGSETTQSPTDSSSESNDEQENEGPAGGVKKAKYKKVPVKYFSTKKGENESSKDRSAQSSPKAKTQRAAGRDKRHSVENAESESEDDTTYIRIPLTKMFDSKSTCTIPKAGTHLKSKYKLIDGPPEITEEKTNEIKNKKCYVMSYNNEKKNANWVYEILNISTLPSCHKKPNFKYSDSNLNHPAFNPGYDRGHLAAAANHKWCQEAYENTYWMSNITPQHKDLNRKEWKCLEKQCRELVQDDNVHNVHVYTGPLYLGITKDSGEQHVPDRSEIVNEASKAVPTHYFKVAIVEKKDGTVEEPQCILITNDKDPEYTKKDIEEIESISGLKFTLKSPALEVVDHKRTEIWTGNHGKKSVTIDVTISSFKKNDEEPPRS